MNRTMNMLRIIFLTTYIFFIRISGMNWYLIQTKPRQEERALANLERQGYHCYLPLVHCEKISKSNLVLSSVALFPRYLFVQLDESLDSKSWSPIRSTFGVTNIVTFGMTPAKISDQLISEIQSLERRYSTQPITLFKSGEPIIILDGPFKGLEGVFQMTNGQDRVTILLNFLNKLTKFNTTPSNIRKVRAIISPHPT